MEQIDYKTLLEFLGKYEEESARVFNKLREADLEAKANILDYGRYSVFKRAEWYGEKYITVRYYDGYENYEYVTSTLMIPADILFDDKKEQMRKAAKKLQEEKERQEYERLKEKFEK